MKRIKTKDIDPKKLITKQRYCEMTGMTYPTVKKKIERGELTVVIADGAELIHL